MHDAWLARFDGDNGIRGELTEVDQPEAEGTSRGGVWRRTEVSLCVAYVLVALQESRDVVLDGV
jgi:hypothetical protein